MTGAFTRLKRSITDWRNQRATVHALSELSDRSLMDIGLHRSEIQSVAAELHGETRPTRTIAVRCVAPITERESVIADPTRAETWQNAA